MRLRLAYGKDGLWVTLPDGVDVTVIEPEYVPGVADEGVALRRALASPLGSPPLADLVRPQDTVAIVFSDITRPMPNDRVLPVLVDALVEAGIAETHITLLRSSVILSRVHVVLNAVQCHSLCFCVVSLVECVYLLYNRDVLAKGSICR